MIISCYPYHSTYYTWRAAQCMPPRSCFARCEVVVHRSRLHRFCPVIRSRGHFTRPERTPTASYAVINHHLRLNPVCAAKPFHRTHLNSAIPRPSPSAPTPPYNPSIHTLCALMANVSGRRVALSGHVKVSNLAGAHALNS